MSTRPSRSLLNLPPVLALLAVAGTAAAAGAPDCPTYHGTYPRYASGCVLSDTGWWFYGDRR